MRTLLTIALTICSFSLHHVASANEPVKKAAVREIEPKELRIKPNRPFQKPVVITSIQELAQRLDMCLKEQLPYELAKHVDFKNEQILFFAWAGSSEDKFAFQVQECKVTKVTFQYQRGRNDDTRRHFRMIVLPKNASWIVAGQKNSAE